MKRRNKKKSNKQQKFKSKPAKINNHWANKYKILIWMKNDVLSPFQLFWFIILRINLSILKLK